MPGKIAENLKIEQLFPAERIGSATVYFNGQSITTSSGVLIDTRDYDELLVVINNGTLNGAAATLSNALYESDTDDPTAATLITGASFNDVTGSSDETIQEASILCKNYKRFIGLRTESQGVPMTIDFGAIGILGKPDSAAVSKTLVFDLDG
jgi:hypothetical protein